MTKARIAIALLILFNTGAAAEHDSVPRSVNRTIATHNEGESTGDVCTGTIIEGCILAAAHCFTKAITDVCSGSNPDTSQPPMTTIEKVEKKGLQVARTILRWPNPPNHS